MKSIKKGKVFTVKDRKISMKELNSLAEKYDQVELDNCHLYGDISEGDVLMGSFDFT